MLAASRNTSTELMRLHNRERRQSCASSVVLTWPTDDEKVECYWIEKERHETKVVNTCTVDHKHVNETATEGTTATSSSNLSEKEEFNLDEERQVMESMKQPQSVEYLRDEGSIELSSSSSPSPKQCLVKELVLIHYQQGQQESYQTKHHRHCPGECIPRLMTSISFWKRF